MSGRWHPAVIAVLWVIYLVAPVRRWGLFEGRPLDLLSTAAVAAVGWLAFRRQLNRGGRLVALALLLKCVLGPTLLLPRGFDARYYANPDFADPIEISIEPSEPTFTRIDRRLRLGFERGPDAPVWFFNDLRFNYYRDTEPKREGLPFSVLWQSTWRVARPTAERVYVRSPGGSVDLTIGGIFSGRIEPSERWFADLTLPAGQHRVSIAWSVPQDAPRRFEAGHVVDGRDVPFDESMTLRRRAGSGAIVADRAIRLLSLAIDACLLAWLVVQVVRSSWDRVAIAWALGIADALVFAWPSFGRMVTLSGGDDWLTYETQARDIAFNGLLMSSGAAPGQGLPFILQPFYAYFLAANHWIFGDGLFGVYFVQRLLVAAAVVALWRATTLIVDEAIGLAALVVAIAVAYEKLAGWSSVLLTETLFAPLVCCWLYTLVRLARAPDGRFGVWALTAGVVGGLATVTRSTLLTAWIVAVPLVALAIPQRRARVAAVAVMLAAMIGVSSLATVRNWIVARKLVFISAQGPVELFISNSPPPLTPPPALKAQYDRIGIDPLVQSVIEYARQKPGAFAAGLWMKARYALGWFETLRPNAGTSSFYIATWVLALVGVIGLVRVHPMSMPLALLPLGLAISQFAVLVIFRPMVYGDRMMVPMYLLLVPLAAVPIAGAARAADRIAPGRLTKILWALLFAATVLRLLGRLEGVDIDVLAACVLVAGLFASGRPQVRFVTGALFAAYLCALVVRLAGEGTNAAAIALRSGALFAAVAMISPAFVRDRASERTIAWTMFALVAVGATLLAAGGFPAGLFTEATRSLRNAFGYTSAVAARAGLAAAAAFFVFPERFRRTRRTLLYTAAAAMTLPALQWAGAPVDPARAFLRPEIATLGAIGAALYAAVWLVNAWPFGVEPTSRIKQGMALGAFATLVLGAVVGPPDATVPVAAGLLIGRIDADRTAVSA